LTASARALPALLLLVGFLGCGEFHTRWLWEEDCPAPTPLVPEALPQVDAALNEPLVVLLRADNAVDEWQLADGILPPGIRLHAEQGLLWGLPEQAGEFPLVLEAVPPDGLCLLPATVDVRLRVSAGCEGRDQCAVPAGLAAHCGEDWVCSASGAWADCPPVFGEGIAWSLEPEMPASPEGPWLVVSHRELTLQDRALPGQEPFVHRIDLLADGQSAVLRYRLPDLWPLPFREGEELVLAEQDWGLAGRELAVWSPDGTVAVRLHEGALADMAPTCPLEVCEIPLQQLHVHACPGEEVQCGRGRPDLLVAGTEPCLAGGHVRTEDPAVGWLAVGAAYSYEPGTFRDELCPGVAPRHASYTIQPESGCPVARIYSAMGSVGVLELGAADEVPPEAVFTGLPFEAARPDDPLMQDGHPTAPDGTRVAKWNWSLLQPYDGLVRLGVFEKITPVDENGPDPRRLPLTAAGIYSVFLDVEDDAGRTSCVADVTEVEVRAASGIDLRVEAVWYSTKGSTQHDLEADLLVMSPPFASYLLQEYGASGWPDDAWGNGAFVCSELNPQPAGWKQSPSPAGPPGEPPPPDYSCRVAGADIPFGLPEVVTVRDLDRDKKTNRYPLAVSAAASNGEALHASVRVFLDGKPRYETRQKVLSPGQIWTVGYVDVALEKFVSAQ
jgi:hypothetical protein